VGPSTDFGWLLVGPPRTPKKKTILCILFLLQLWQQKKTECERQMSRIPGAGSFQREAIREFL
jgi:hypothetical protein